MAIMPLKQDKCLSQVELLGMITSRIPVSYTHLIYDDRLLVKPKKSAVSYMETATYELPYDGAKEMLLVEDLSLIHIYQAYQFQNFAR